MTREELLASDPKAREMYVKLRNLRSSVDAIKGHTVELSAEEMQQAISDSRKSATSETGSSKPGGSRRESLTEAEKAVIKKTREESEFSQRRKLEMARKQAQRIKQMEEASRKAAAKQREAELMKQRALEAAKTAEMSRATQAGSAEEIIAAQAETRVEAERASKNVSRHEPSAKHHADSAADKTARRETMSHKDLEELQDVLKTVQSRQGQVLERVSDITDTATSILSERHESSVKELTKAQEDARLERERQKAALRNELEESRAKRKRESQQNKARHEAMEAQLKEQEKRKKAELKAEQAALAASLKAEQAAQNARIKAEKAAQKAQRKAEQNAEAAKRRALKAAEEARIKAEKRERKERIEREEAAKRAEELRIREERKDKARKLWRERDEKRQAKRRQRREDKLREAENELRIHQEIERYRNARKQEEDELTRLWKIRKKDAARGGGIVTVHDITIRTEINKRENIRLRDLLGIRTREERNAKTEEERMALRMEREYRREDARAKFSFNRMLSIRTWENSALGRKWRSFEEYCATHKKKIITVSSALATTLVCVATLISYCSAYEYSYNGTPLGFVKNKNDVLDVTDLIKGAMSEDNNVDVVIGEKDITFERVPNFGDIKIDTTENVLNRLTYMSDFKVASYGIYVDGSKIGAVQTKEDAKQVLETIKEKYVTTADETVIQQAVFLEKVDVKECSTKLGNMLTTAEMVDVLTSDVNKETVHSAVAGETVEYIAKEYGTTEKKILKDNPNLKKGKVDAGTPVFINTTAPPVTVLIKEKISYTEAIDYEVEETKDKNMYEGDKEVTQKGEKGSRNIVAEIVTVNGNEIERDTLESTVTKEPVTKKITIGTKERPPTVGDGKFSSPIHDSYRLSSGFKMRWGRFHKGIDMACPTGTKVHAADGGTVVTASYKPSYGNLVEIDHQNGYLTKYAHNSKILVKPGDKVYEGQVVALVGSTGNSTGPHCHFEVRYHGDPKNPLNFISIH